MIIGDREESENIVDRRGAPNLIAKGGIGTLIVGAIIYYFMGGNPITYVEQNAGTVSGQTQSVNSETDEARRHFSAVVLKDTEDVWTQQFKSAGKQYQAPTMVLFRNRVQSACGTASTAVGPFYCPADQRVYLDLSFFDELSDRLGAHGDFAQAYVIAHEIGHHVQNLLGLDRAFNGSRNQISVRTELQADCLAGVWAKQDQQTKQVIEPGDIKEAMEAAEAVGDDRLQQDETGTVTPDSFTHGSSAQREQSFMRGYQGGQLQSCTD